MRQETLCLECPALLQCFEMPRMLVQTVMLQILENPMHCRRAWHYNRWAILQGAAAAALRGLC